MTIETTTTRNNCEDDEVVKPTVIYNMMITKGPAKLFIMDQILVEKLNFTLENFLS